MLTKLLTYRFASVYREYQDVTVFIEELKNLQNRSEELNSYF